MLKCRWIHTNCMGTEKEQSGPEVATLLRQIPAVDELLNQAPLREVASRVGRRVVGDATRQVLDGLRQRIISGASAGFSLEDLESEIVAEAKAAVTFSLQRVINATGVILHTNLGRAPLAREALAHLGEAAAGYSNLEYDLEGGHRGKRDAHTDRLFHALLGAERALVVNNNAAAVFLALNTLGEGWEVIVSRGELIEIGGSFRIPDICAKSGALLHEVGTTNRTRLADYAAGINDRTRLLLRVHPSNFRIVGFTERPGLEEMVDLAHRRGLLLMEDLGSGCLVDLAPWGVQDEPPARRSLEAGVDIATFSGDKLLGGPQAGILVGKSEPLERIRKNPLFRALRVDKLTIAALEATASLYLQGRLEAIPALRMIQLTPKEIAPRARRLAEKISAQPGFVAVVRAGESVVGGGSTPGQTLATELVAVSHVRHSANGLEEMLRRQRPAVLGRVEEDQLMLDLRTVFESDEAEIIRAFMEIT